MIKTMAVGSDTACHLTEEITRYLESKGIEVEPHGALVRNNVDYVDGALEVARAVATGACDAGLLFCTTGTGASMVANKVPGARATLCMDYYAAKISRLANNANILVISIRLTGELLAKEIVDTWLASDPATADARRLEFHRKVDAVDDLYRRPA